jgi:hypothetical protein
MDNPSEGSLMAKNSCTTLEELTKQNRRMSFIARHFTMTADWHNVGEVIQIDVLPDDVLLQIFDLYVYVEPVYVKRRIWQTLVHVCRRWRTLVFQLPRRLDLQLCYRTNTTAKNTLDIWPALPLNIWGDLPSSSVADNVIAVLEQSNRIRQVFLYSIDIPFGQFEKLLAAMQFPFPELTSMHLNIFLHNRQTPPTIPDSFLGGSAPRLQEFKLTGIPFPGLPKLLLSANHLHTLELTRTPHSGYISPEAIVTLISALPILDTLDLGFQSPQSRPNWRSHSLPPPKRFFIPLRRFDFTGVTEYLEELVTGIDTPQLEFLHITFFNQIDFDCPRLAHFINRTPTFRAFFEARVRFNQTDATVELRSQKTSRSRRGYFQVTIGVLCRKPNWQISSIEQICNSCLTSPSTSTIEDLDIGCPSLGSTHAIENTVLLQLFLPFTAVKDLYLAYGCERIAAALEGLVGGGITEVLPNLEKIFVRWLEVWRSFQKDTEQFVAARQLSGHPVTIVQR